MRGAGRAIFIATLLLIAGVLNMIYGIAAVANASFWVDNNNFVLSGLHTWGWVTIVIAVLQLVAALSLYGGRLFGRIIGIFAASLGAIAALLDVGGAYPFWSLGVFALCLWCLHGLFVYGEPAEA